MPKHKPTPTSEYTTVRLPKQLLQEIDQLVRSHIHGYRSRAEFITESARMRLETVKATPPQPKLPTLEHFNLNEDGIRIVDRTLATKTTNGRIIDVFFKPNDIWCDHCQSDNCQHVKFALELIPVKEILTKKGWNPKS